MMETRRKKRTGGTCVKSQATEDDTDYTSSSHAEFKKPKMAELKQNQPQKSNIKPLTDPIRPPCLTRNEFNKSGIDLAKYLLGKIIIRVLDTGEKLAGRIVETEAYLGEIDKACHTYGGRKTAKTEAMYMEPGTAYVYFIYGMYFCLNISSADQGGCVLIRALQPVQGQETMQKLRSLKRKAKDKQLKEHMLCNGPSKLCQAMDIGKENLNKEDMVSSNIFWVADDGGEVTEDEIITSKRIGIDSYGPEWASKPYRFYVFGNKSVSVRDKEAEKTKQNIN